MARHFGIILSLFSAQERRSTLSPECGVFIFNTRQWAMVTQEMTRYVLYCDEKGKMNSVTLAKRNQF
jgi:hypothetical protein